MFSFFILMAMSHMVAIVIVAVCQQEIMGGDRFRAAVPVLLRKILVIM